MVVYCTIVIMIALVAVALDPVPSVAAVAEAYLLDHDITRRRKQHHKACSCERCFLRIRIPDAVRVAIVIRKAMRKVDDYEYDLHKLHEDISPVIETTFKVVGKAQAVLTVYWGSATLPCMQNAETLPKWEVSEMSLQDSVRRLMRQGSQGLADSVLAVYDEALAELWGRGMPCARPATLAAVAVSFAHHKVGVLLDIDDIAQRFGISTETVKKAVKRAM